ncbi:DNase I-like protein [Dioscorea alata]|uniref:DNase I-like protein n=1 Tax=Dioscorea alata TaxID=55571 RepID=A0ACB7VXY4_DIOAL|nr:DNase I-like protein [Dioscorea alata]
MTLQNWEMVHNYANSNLGRIWILYDASKIKLIIIESNLQYIHYKVEWRNAQFSWTCVYGSYDVNIKKMLWQDLVRILGSVETPWLRQGNFNTFLSNCDRMGGILVNQEVVEEFQGYVLNLDLLEVQYSGPKFTWTNFQDGG